MDKSESEIFNCEKVKGNIKIDGNYYLFIKSGKSFKSIEKTFV